MGYLEGSYLPCKESGYNYRSHGLILSTNQCTKKNNEYLRTSFPPQSLFFIRFPKNSEEPKLDFLKDAWYFCM